MFRLTCVLLALGLASGEQCYQGDLKIDGQSVSQDDFVRMTHALASERAAHVAKTNKQFHQHMTARKMCQDRCFGRVFPTSFKTLIGNVGNDLFNASSGDLAVESLTGAFLACYPEPPREHVQDVVTKCVNMPDTVAQPADATMLKAAGGACSGPEGSTKQDRDDFMQMFSTEFPKAMKKVLKAHPEVAKELLMKKDCQKNCLGDNLVAAVTNLWDSGLIAHPNAHEYATKALTGAAKACFPRVPQATMESLITEIKDNALQSAQESAQAKQAMLDNMAAEETMDAEPAQTSSLYWSIPAACVFGLVAGTVVHFAMLRFSGKRARKANEEPLLTA